MVHTVVSKYSEVPYSQGLMVLNTLPAWAPSNCAGVCWIFAVMVRESQHPQAAGKKKKKKAPKPQVDTNKQFIQMC